MVKLMKNLKRLLVCVLCFCLAAQPVFATRYMNSKQNAENSAAENSEADDISAKLTFDDQQNWSGKYYNTNLPGTRIDEKLFEGYTFDGQQIEPPEFDLYRRFAAEEITSFSDAIVDYRGWDIALGATDFDRTDNSIRFKVSSSSLYNEKNFGYGLRKFGCETYEFDFKIESDSEKWPGFVGFNLLSGVTQAPSWQSGAGGYLVCLKEDCVEFQRYAPSQEIVVTENVGAISPNVWHRSKINIAKDGDKKITNFVLDGKEVFRYTDQGGADIADEGYFNLMCYAGNKISLRAVNPTVSQNEKYGENDSESNIIALKIGSSNAMVNGQICVIDDENRNVVPYTDADRTLVPLRFLSENLGAYVTYNDKYHSARLDFDECSMEFTEGFAEYRLDDDWFISDCKASVMYDRMYVPARVIAEAIGKKIDYADGYVFISDHDIEPEERNLYIQKLN